MTTQVDSLSKKPRSRVAFDAEMPYRRMLKSVAANPAYNYSSQREMILRAVAQLHPEMQEVTKLELDRQVVDAE